jgi:hypothetical protein
MRAEHHFHIRWSNSKVDWKAFSTREEASEAAELIKIKDENYIIEQYAAECGPCRAFERGELLLSSSSDKGRR